MKTSAALLIMDGFGLGPEGPYNAIKNSRTPVLDELFASCPRTELEASGLQVGLPEGQIGNSEVGHTNIGAGRVVFQELPRISLAISNGSFFENPALRRAMDACLVTDGALHLMGLLSDGGVHSHIDHLRGLLKMAAKRGLTRVYIHCFMDGRDVSPTSGQHHMRQCVKMCEEIGVGSVATVSGRYYAMDRDKRWDRVYEAYRAMVYGEGEEADDPVELMEASYNEGITDEFIVPHVCDPEGIITGGDSVVFFNFRPDRAREITRALVDPDFDGFKRLGGALNLNFVCMTKYDATMPNVSVAFPPEEIRGTLGEYLSSLGLSQLRIAETEKYAHVTFFFNGGVEEPFAGEDRILIASPRDVATYDLVPEMSAYKVAEKAAEAIRSGKYDIIICNLANCDMVGHTGIYDAAVRAVEAVDDCVGTIIGAVKEVGGFALITADHGNAEYMREPDGISPNTAHTTNPVPLLLVGADCTLKTGKLCDLAPTLLHLLGLEKPQTMTGESLIC